MAGVEGSLVTATAAGLDSGFWTMTGVGLPVTNGGGPAVAARTSAETVVTAKHTSAALKAQRAVRLVAVILLNQPRAAVARSGAHYGGT